MSLPSDVTADVSEAMGDGASAVRGVAGRSIDRLPLSREQVGLIAAAGIAFLGIAILGPALTRIGKPKPLSRRAEDAARDLRERTEAAAGLARDAGQRVGKRVGRQAGRLRDQAGWR